MKRFQRYAYPILILAAVLLLIAANAPIDLPWTDQGRYSRAGVQSDVNRTSCANAATTTLEASPGGNIPAVFGFGSLVVIGSDARVGFTVTTRGTDVTLGDQTTENAFLATSAAVNPDGRATGSPIYAAEKHDLVVELHQINGKPYLYSGMYCNAALSAVNTPGGEPLYPPCLADADCTGSGANQFALAGGTLCRTVAQLVAASSNPNQNLEAWESRNGGVTVRVRNDSGAAALVDWDLKR